MRRRKRILFFSHAVTLAHFARPLKWIESLDCLDYEVFIASHSRYKELVSNPEVKFIEINCIDAAQFAETVERAAPIYDLKTYQDHIAEDIQIMDSVQPDLVIGDYRLSLSVSCRLKKIKYVSLANAYWSSNVLKPFPLPEAPLVRALGEKLSAWVLFAFLSFIMKFNFFTLAFALRKPLRQAGLFFNDFRQLITDGDITIYCETPELIPLKEQKKHERFIGPIVWSMPVPLPDWWTNLDKSKKRIFVSLGSSGPAKSLPLILRALSKWDAEIVVARAGNELDLPQAPNIHVTNFLPIEEACGSSDLIICNGGSPMCHAALTYGVPVIGVVCNNDQLLNMRYIEDCSAGLMLRYWNLTEDKIINAVEKIFTNSKYSDSAKMIKLKFEEYQQKYNLAKVLDEILNGMEPK